MARDSAIPSGRALHHLDRIAYARPFGSIKGRRALAALGGHGCGLGRLRRRGRPLSRRPFSLREKSLRPDSFRGWRGPLS